MNISLQYKLFSALLGSIVVAVVYMALVLQWSFDRGFLHYVNTTERAQLHTIADELEAVYGRHLSWHPVVDNPSILAQVIISSYPEGKQKERFLARARAHKLDRSMVPAGPLPGDLPVPFFRRVFLLDEQRQVLIGYSGRHNVGELIEIRHQNLVVGYLGVHPAKHLYSTHHLVFVEQQKVALLLVAAAGVLIAAGFSLPISYMLTRPIRRLAAATRRLASGQYATRVVVQSGDEFGQLCRDFNDLADTLEKNRTARSQWVTDISHELRTPLSVLRGKIEALQDGVHAPVAETFDGLHREVMHLGWLVDDLYQLSLSDVGAMSYNRREVQPCWALEQAVELLEPEIAERALTLETEVDIDEEAALFADNERLKQLFINLLANSLRYTDAGGVIRLVVKQQDAHILYLIEDSAPAVPDDNLPLLFDRFYRVEGSRSREHGGAGIGLSICYNIVKGHNGTIEASHSALGGLQVRIQLPCVV